MICPHCGNGLAHADFTESMNEIQYCDNEDCPIAPQYQFSIIIPNKLPAIIMAGRDNGVNELLIYADVKYKALITFNDKTILEHIVRALENSGVISRYYIIGLPRTEVPDFIDVDRSRVSILETPDMSFTDRIMLVTSLLMGEKLSPHALIVNGDIPFIRGETIRKFVKSIDWSKQLHLTALSQETMEARFPESHRTYGRIDRGKYCFGDMAVFDLDTVESQLELMRMVRENRKNFIKVILKARPMAIIRYILRRLTMEKLNETITRVTGVRTEVIEVEDAGVGMDIDKPLQLDISRKEFEQLELLFRMNGVRT